MPGDQLVPQPRGHVVDVEATGTKIGLGGDPRVEQHLQEDIAELLEQRVRIAELDRVEGLVGLLEQIPGQAVVRLFGIPRTLAPQDVHHCDELDQALARGHRGVAGIDVHHRSGSVVITWHTHRQVVPLCVTQSY
jgi:hypothetical protein